MNCPFLKEARVKHCEKSAFRKMIRISGNAAQETCTSARYAECSVYRRYKEESGSSHCPYLRETLAQYCAATPVSRFIPYSEPSLSRCGSESYRYCDVYLGASQPAGRKAGGTRDDALSGMYFPDWLDYSANHLWLDMARGGSCHLGLDAFLARVLGTVERITFLKQRGVQRPTVVLTVQGVDLEVVFPNPITLTACNLYLRANPGKLTGDPYGVGWLFQGVAATGCPPPGCDLIQGSAMAPWMEGEIGRMSAFLTECQTARQSQELMQDGGAFSPDLLQHLNREETLRLFHEFFWGMRETHAAPHSI